MAKRKRKLGSRTLAVVVLIIVLIVASMLLYGWFALGKTPAETFNYFAAMIKRRRIFRRRLRRIAHVQRV